MGDPKKLRKKYSTPRHLWNADSIKEDKELIKEYGLRNKKEIWKVNSFLKKYKDLAKQLISIKTAQGEKEKAQMLDKLQRIGLIQAGAELDDVLDLNVRDVMERRLQSLVFRTGLARSMTQARQFITHRHIMVGDKKITFPSYIVSQEEEAQLGFDSTSALNDEEHPERAAPEKSPKEEQVPQGSSKAETVVEEKKPKKEKKEEEVPSAEKLIEETKEKFAKDELPKEKKEKQADELIEESKK